MTDSTWLDRPDRQSWEGRDTVARSFQIVVDCHDPVRMAEFWAAVLDYVPDRPPAGSDWMDYQVRSGFPSDERVEFAAISGPDGVGRLCFMKVPEPKTGKNRVHLDIRATRRGSGLDERTQRVDALVSRLHDLGATSVRTGCERGHYFVTMLDIEGNEFCVH